MGSVLAYRLSHLGYWSGSLMANVANCISLAELTSLDRIPGPIAQKFPVSNPAWGFVTDLEEPLPTIHGMLSPHYLAGAVVSPESSYLEPTLGQIWPRIG